MFGDLAFAVIYPPQMKGLSPWWILTDILWLCLLTGINMVKRKLAAHDNLKISIEQTGDKFHIKEASNFRTLELDFTLGVTFEYSLADGTELSVSLS